MKRTDYEALQIVGHYLMDTYDWVLSTGMTKQGEDYLTDIIITTSGKPRNIEVKTIRDGKRPYKSKKLRIEDEVFGDGNFWLLNKTANKYGKSKWDKFLDHSYDGLIFYDDKNNTLYIYDWQQVMDAYRGDCELYVSHTTEFGDRQPQWETKVVIDLGKGKKVQL